MINPGNIEKWMFDFFEGNLTPHEEVEFHRFLEKNPQYLEDLGAWSESYNLPSEEPYFIPSYDYLKQEKTPTRIAWYSAASILTLAGLIWMLLPQHIYQYTPRTGANSTPSIHQESKEEYQQILLSQNNFKNTASPTGLLSENPAEGKIYSSADKKNESATSVDSSVDYTVEKLIPIEAAVFVTEMEEEEVKKGKSEKLVLKGKKSVEGFEDISKLKFSGNQGKLKNFFEVLSEKEVALTNYGDPIFIQSDADMLQVNPALAGAQNNNRLSYNGRYQWPSDNHVQIQNRISYDGKVSKSNAISVQVANMMYGREAISTNEVSLGYAKYLKLGRNAKMAIGVKGNLAQISLNKEKLVGLGLLEFQRGMVKSAPETQNNASKLAYGGGAGLWLNTEYFHVGASVSSITPSALYAGKSVSDQMLNQNYLYSVQVGTDYKKNPESKLIVSPSVVFNSVKGYSEVWMASLIRYNSFVGGAGLSTQNSGRATAGFDTGRFRMMYAIDQTKSVASNQFMISHEVSMKLLLGKINKTESILQFD